MSSVNRLYALSKVNNAAALKVSSGTGFNWANPYVINLDMRYNTIFTFDLTPINFNGTSICVVFDTRPGAPIQNTGKTVTIIISGFTNEKRQVSTRYTQNFGSPGSVVGDSNALGALNQINTNSASNEGGASAINLISNGDKFVFSNSSYFD